jgi:hypothetical protein
MILMYNNTTKEVQANARFTIDTSNNAVLNGQMSATTFRVSSDYRIKNNVVSIPDEFNVAVGVAGQQLIACCSIGQNNTFPNWIDGRNYQDLTGGTPQITEPTDAGGISYDSGGWTN